MLDFDDQIVDDYDDARQQQQQNQPRRTLSSIFKKNQRIKVRELKLHEDAPAVAVVTHIPLLEKPIEEVEFNSKLSWLQPTTSSAEAPGLLSLDFQNDYPVLSVSNNKIITKMCPKINDGFKCSRVNCYYQHPPTEEVQKIVSDMRSLKKRVVKDVLKVIDTTTSEKRENKESSHPSSRGNNKPQQQNNNNHRATTRMCKFLDKCKFKDTTCSYSHSVEELNIKSCQFGSKCKLVSKNPEGQFINTNIKKKCGFIHPNESKDMYLTRQK